MATFFVDYFKGLDSTLSSFVTSKAAAVISSISSVTTTMFVIYVAFYVLAIAMGKVKEPLFDFSLRIVLVSLILGIGLNMGLYMKFLGDFLNKAPDQMAAVLAGASAKGSIGATLDKIMSDAFDAGTKAFENLSLIDGIGSALIMLLIGILLYAVGVIATLYAAFLIVLAKIAIAVLLALGPIAIVLLMFKSTQRFFEAWLGQALNYGLLVVLTVAVVTLMFDPLVAYVAEVNKGAEVKLVDALILVVTAGLGVLVLRQVPSIAAGLGGGMSISTLGFAERLSGGLYSRTWQRQPYTTTDSNGNPQTVHRRPAPYRAGQAMGVGVNVAKNLYRRGTGQGSNRVDRA